VKIESIGLLGFGRFGAMAFQYLNRDKEVRVFDSDPDRVHGLAQAVSFEKAVAAQLVLLCIPISDMEEACRKMAPLLGSGQIVVDTCSVKRRPIDWMAAHLPESVQILGTHPLFGPDSAKEGIEGLTIALCPVRIQPEMYADIRGYLKRLQLNVVEPTPDDHDEQLARGQAVFHLIAQAMKRLEWAGQAISTPGPEAFYRLVETVRHDTDQLFHDMERENPYAAQFRKRFIQEVLTLDQELSEEAEQMASLEKRQTTDPGP